MSNAVSGRVAFQLGRMRKRNGVPILFEGKTYYVTKGAVSGAQAGAQGFPKNDLGPAIAALNAHVFVFSAADFQPNTDKFPPTEGSILTDHVENYRVTNYDFGDIATDTHSIYVYALRDI
jgi:hypothetical protein